MGVQLTDGTNNNVVDATSKGIVVQNPKVVTQAGYALLATNEDNGTVTGSVLNRPASISIDGRLSVGIDTNQFTDLINYTAQNTAVWQDNLTTMTLTYSGGYAFLNAGASLASGAFAVHKTYKPFPLFTGGGVHAEFRGFATTTPQINNILAIGIGTPGTTAAPTDGAYFQWSAAGLFNAVVNWNGTTTLSANLTPPPTNPANEFLINETDDNVEFWINGVLQAVLSLPSGAATSSFNGAAYAFIQCTNTGATSAAQGFKLASINVWQEDMNTNKPYSHQQVGNGLSIYQGQNGGTMGSTAYLPASGSAPTAGVPSNTAALTNTGLGGHFLTTNTIAINVDGIVSSYQNPVGTINQTPRTIFITGVKIDTAVSVALTGGPELLVWEVAFGHTSVSLATAEAATTKAPRRVPIGMQSFGTTSPVGTLGNPIIMTFNSPIPVQPGEFIQTVYRNAGVVGTAGQFAHSITFDGYQE